MTDGKHEVQSSTKFVLKATPYEILKWLAAVAIPGFAAAYFSLAQIWPELPFPDKVVGTATVIGTLIGLLVARSSQNFKNQGADGSINATIDEEEQRVVLSKISLPDISPEELAGKKSITIQVNPDSGSSQ